MEMEEEEEEEMAMERVEEGEREREGEGGYFHTKFNSFLSSGRVFGTLRVKLG